MTHSALKTAINTDYNRILTADFTPQIIRTLCSAPVCIHHQTSAPNSTSIRTHQVPHNGCFGEYPLPRFTCQRLTADHHCRDPLTSYNNGKLNQTLVQRWLARPLGIQPGVAQQRHERVFCGCGTRAFRFYHWSRCRTGSLHSSSERFVRTL